MGFRGTLMEGTCRVQIYSQEEYELLQQVVLEGLDKQFTDLSLVIDN